MQLSGSYRGDLTAPFGGALGSKYPPGMPSLGPHRNLLVISPRCSAVQLHDPGSASATAGAAHEPAGRLGSGSLGLGQRFFIE